MGYLDSAKTVSIAMRLGVVGLALLLTKCQFSPHTTSQDIDKAVEGLRLGEIKVAIQSLQAIVDEHPEDTVGDRAALCLGNALIQQQRHRDALKPLRRAAQGRVGADYARLLFVNAIVEGEIVVDYEEALQTARQLIGSGSASSVIEEEADFSVFKLLWLRQEWESAASQGREFLSRYPERRRSDEVRWLTAESLRLAGRKQEAQALYTEIWFEKPGSSWSKESHQKMVDLGTELGIKPPVLPPDRLRDFALALRRAGLHEFALQAVERFLRLYPEHRFADRMLLYKAMSEHALVRNRDCVKTVEDLRDTFPNSSLVPSAVLYAIRALRRHNDVPAVRRWVNWVNSRYPGRPEAYEALYNLGVFLANVADENEGLRVLREFVRRAPRHDDVPDALWRIVWILHKQGRNDEALQVLGEILERSQRSQDRKAALYWKARFLMVSDPEKAKEYFLACLKEFPNDYYGQQSHENLLALGVTPPEVRSRKPFPSVDRLDDPSARPDLGEAYSRAVHLRRIGLFEFACLELLSEPGVTEDSSLQFALASLYSRSGKPWEAVRILHRRYQEFILSGSRDPALVPEEFWRILNPFNYRAFIVQAIHEAGLEKTGIDPYLVAALIRHESLFLPNAVSPVGAVGLMQLMPSTAKDIARKRHIPEPSRSDLFDPETNIRFGIFYLAERIQEFKGDYFPAVCSYNAGPGAVKKWWGRKPSEQPRDEFIEMIPFAATRGYIKDVMGTYRNYEWLYAQDSR